MAGNFEGACISPKLFIVLVMMRGTPKERHQAIAKLSCITLEDAYGFEGMVVSHSLCPPESFETEPYTSSVENCKNTSGFTALAYSSMVSISSVLFLTKGSGSSIEPWTSEREARLIM